MTRWAATLMVAALGGCSMVPHYVRPAAPVPAALPAGGIYPGAGNRAAPAALPANATDPQTTDAGLPTLSYRDIFRDPRLQKLIEQALANNRDLRATLANIDTARAQFNIVRAEQLPTIGGTVSLTESDSGTGRTNANGSPVVGGRRSNFNINSTIAAFEIDLFGRVRALTEAQQAQFFASEANARALRLTLTGDVAAAWLRYAADESLYEIATQTVESAGRSVMLAHKRVEGGVAPRTEVDLAQTVLATAQVDLALQKTAIAQDENALRLLVGAEIDRALLPASIIEAAPTIAELPAGLDSAVLLGRPDIVAAEYRLRAANAQVGAARAALFPRISLTTLAGLASNTLSRLFTGGAFNYSGTPGISYTLFSGGAGNAGVAQARAQFNAAVATYERAIQTAFREVADALARRGTIAEQRAAQALLASAAADNAGLAELRFGGGVASLLDALDAQRSSLAAQRALANAELVEAANLVTLYRVLGGDQRIEAAKSGPTPPAQ